MTTLLFGQPGKGARHVWNASEFTNVDDTVRGGSSTSKMSVVTRNADCADEDVGSIDFSGNLDTTTLGGAGFASQSYMNSFPGQAIDAESFEGLRLIGRRLPQAIAHTTANGTYPGGGKGPVTSYVVNLKTVEPTYLPDGRRQSEIVYEWTVQLGNASEKAIKEGAIFDFQSSWADFHPTYRGRPAPDAPTLDPAQVKEWSIMARSEFGSQSGPFSVRLLGLGAVHTNSKTLQARSVNRTFIGHNSSGEYYGFALFIFATVAMIVWTIWALTPDRILRNLGIDWFPNREWAFLIPAWSMFAVLFAYAAFISLNTFHNAPLDDISNVVDSHSNILPISPASEDLPQDHPLDRLSSIETAGSHGPLANDVYDLPPGFVSREKVGL